MSMTGNERDLMLLARKAVEVLEAIADELGPRAQWAKLAARVNASPTATPDAIVREVSARLDVAELDNADVCKLASYLSTELPKRGWRTGGAGRRAVDVAIAFIDRLTTAVKP